MIFFLSFTFLALKHYPSERPKLRERERERERERKNMKANKIGIERLYFRVRYMHKQATTHNIYIILLSIDQYQCNTDATLNEWIIKMKERKNRTKK